MVKGDGAQRRKERLEEIAKFVQAALHQSKEAGDEGISLSKTVVQLMLLTGLKELTVKEYLGLLEKAGQFEMNVQADKIHRAAV
jgi:hypothetical protein